jgi:hypothetical protein
MASTYLTRTPASTGNRKTWTFSAWVKRGNLSSNQNFGINQQDVANNNIMVFTLGTNNKLDIYDYNGGVSAQLTTNRVFRDTSAWYHIVVAVDTTNATADDRMKIYVNGVQETSFDNRTNPSLNYDFNLNQSGKLNVVGAYAIGSIVNHFDGQMTHIHFIDGTAYDASTFGETDTATGIWKPIFTPTVTYGTNGFFLKFENSGAFGTDSSPNGNNFTVNGTMTQTIDTPSNVFATWNPLINTNGVVYSKGNLNANLTGNANWGRGVASSYVVSQGKWYWEIKQTSSQYNINGIIREDDLTWFSGQSGTALYNRNMNALQSDGTIYANGTGTGAAYTYTTGDIVMFALDMNDKKMYVGKNGTWFNSGNPSAGTNEIFDSSDFTSGYGYCPSFLGYDLGTAPIVDANFGNGVFGSTPLTGTTYSDTAGLGIFKYEVPAGYKAICTKSINAQEYS